MVFKILRMLDPGRLDAVVTMRFRVNRNMLGERLMLNVDRNMYQMNR